ncbi:hypothetical protein [Fibrella forsythiae]|uniref:DUF1361 domain-containing protein n=1 Tax=Fibrella forsythiae TaxID=2817061 RepID=A0ABS3JII9_9BACT|nr:hypothetical protein [Fibrella forsythiae]MBO0949812.1 hypothetical protein [Fibrella forsythiae]
MNIIHSLIGKTGSKPFIFILIGLLVVFNILMNAPGLPTSTPSMQNISPTFTPFDLQAKGYNVDSFTNDLNELGIEGRTIYKNFMICDIFFPSIYAFTFSSLIFLIFRKRKNWSNWLFLIPLLTGLVDYIENIFIAIAFSDYPSSDHLTVSVASLATQAKMSLNALLILSLLFTLGTWLAALVKNK